MEKFSIFYSWQSDLPPANTRNFIRNCIDKAVDKLNKAETFVAERDEATLGLTGSPNIVESIYSKIDSCDLFVADVSLCFTQDGGKAKRSPNPNVLFELGYAVKVLGWERVICICNIDYGEKLPFDIAQNRITKFTVENSDRATVKQSIVKIIIDNIEKLQKEIPKARDSKVAYIVGSYDFEMKCMIRNLAPLNITHRKEFISHNSALLHEARILVDEINRLSCAIQNAVVEIYEEDDADYSPNDRMKQLISSLAVSYKSSEVSVKWENVEKDKERMKRLLGVEVQDDFFNLGNLKKTVMLFGNGQENHNGTEEEREKYEKLQRLSDLLLDVDIRNNYLKTFDGMLFVPFAIQNISRSFDENITIYLQIGKGESVVPNRELIWDEYDGLQSMLCRDEENGEDEGIIYELFHLDENSSIHIEEDIGAVIHKTRVPELTPNGYQVPEKTEEDYEDELKEFIAPPTGENRYEFEIRSLRPGECKWFSRGILVRPENGEIKASYQISSNNTDGSISGELALMLS